MITEPTLMPDFRDSLEQALYRRAVATAPARTMPRISVPRQSLLGRLALGATVLAAAIAVILTSITGHAPTTRAYATPLILREPAQGVPQGLRPGAEAKGVLGQNVHFDRAVAFPVFGLTGYLLQGQAGWCMVLPDPQGNVGESSERCATTHELRRVGVASVMGSTRFVAVIPPTAEPPTLVESSGKRVSLAPSPLGIVVATGLHDGDTILVHGVDGRDQRWPIRTG